MTGTEKDRPAGDVVNPMATQLQIVLLHDLYPRIFLEGIFDTIHILHDAIAYDAAHLKTDDMEYTFDNYHSSRIVSRIILGPAFTAILWKKHLKGSASYMLMSTVPR